MELGRVNINTEVSMLASQMALPREGHLEAVFHIFAYLKRKYNSRMVSDPTYPNVNMNDFKICARSLYHPTPRCLGVRKSISGCSSTVIMLATN